MGQLVSRLATLGLCAAAVLAPGCGRQAAKGSLKVPRGATISVSVDTTLSSRTNHEGDRFAASLTAPFQKGEKIFVPLDAKVDGVVQGIDRHDDRERIRVRLTRLHLPGGRTLALRTNVIVRDAEPPTGEAAQPAHLTTGLDQTIRKLAGDRTGNAAGGSPATPPVRPAVIRAGSPLVFTLASDLLIPPPPPPASPR